MGKAAKSVTKVVKKAVKATAKTAESFVKSPIDQAKSLAKGDLMGSLDAATRAVTGGIVSLEDKGLLNANLNPKVKDASDPVQQTDTQTDGLLQYVSDLRTRKARRNRTSTNNTDGSASGSANKLSGTTALGV